MTAAPPPLLLREDGRRGDQIRPPDYEHGLLKQADGSVRVQMGRTTVVAGVFGPGDVDGRRELPDRAAINVGVQPLVGPAGPAERKIEQLLRGVVEHAVLVAAHPRTLINVAVQVVCDDGALLAAAINAVIAALLDAGIAMRAFVAAAACAVSGSPSLPSQQQQLLLLDPTRREETAQDARATVTAAFDATGDNKGEVVLCESTRCIPPTELRPALAACRLAADAVARFVRISTQQQCQKDRQTTSVSDGTQ